MTYRTKLQTMSEKSKFLSLFPQVIHYVFYVFTIIGGT